jgi:iron complex transport system ATP-binding protein
MTVAIDVQQLSHFFATRPVLDELTFSIGSGDFFIIIGPNGAGKTTLMRSMGGLLSPRQGEIRIFEKSIAGYRKKDLAQLVAYVPQGVPLEFPFSVAEVVLMGRAPYHSALGIERKADFEIADRAMRFTGVDSLASRRLDQLSGGELQRVMVARAICQEPRILLLDEPTASLDLAHQVHIMDLMENLKTERGTTVVMVSHDINLAGMYGDQLLLVKEGRILQQGVPADVLKADKLEDAYQCPVLVDEGPVNRMPRVTVVPRKYRSPEKR